VASVLEPAIHRAGRTADINAVQERPTLARLYRDGYPLVCVSARAALAMIQKEVREIAALKYGFIREPPSQKEVGYFDTSSWLVQFPPRASAHKDQIVY
jgi:hypothetical protein